VDHGGDRELLSRGLYACREGTIKEITYKVSAVILHAVSSLPAHPVQDCNVLASAPSASKLVANQLNHGSMLSESAQRPGLVVEDAGTNGKQARALPQTVSTVQGRSLIHPIYLSCSPSE